MLVVDAVHISPHHQNSAAVFGKKVFGRQRIRNSLWVEPFALVPDDEEKLSARFATKTQVNMLVGVFVVAMNHGVGDSFAEPDLDIASVPVKTLVMLHAIHEFIDERRNFGNGTGHGQLELRM